MTNRKFPSRVISSLITATLAGCGAMMTLDAQAAVPGITGDSGLAAAAGAKTTFNLTARAGAISQPDGAALYSWGYGCTVGATTSFAPSAFGTLSSCSDFQVPAPTLIVREGTVVTVNLTNNLPAPAGNTSIVFPGFQVSAQQTNVATLTIPATVPAAASATVTASTSATYADTGVVNSTTTTALTKVTTPPLQGQYAVVGALYTFNALDSGTAVVISGTTATPATVTTTSTATLGTAPFPPVVISTDPTYVDTGVTSPSGALTVGTQYTVAGGSYTFIDATLAGQLLTITGTVVSTTTTPVTLTATIPVVTGPMVVASTAVGFVNKGVVYGTGAISPAVAGNAVTPVSIVGGTYTFSIADAGQPVVISGTAPVTANTGTAGLLTQEAAPGGTVTYTFTATKPGTYAYYSGTQPELQIEMGMYGAVIVLPSIAMDTACPTSALSNYSDFRLAHAAYDHPQTCYDREYLFQFAEADSRINVAAETQVLACAAARAANANAVCAPVTVKTEPFIPNYFLINGRSMPDLMDGDFIPNFPNQPYNGNPHIRPGEMLLMRTIGQGRIQHPFHIHGDHARTLARDGNLIVAQVDPSPLPNPLGTGTVNRLAGPLIFTVPTVSGQAIDGLFSWSGKGLNWDVYGPTNHTCNGKAFPGYGGTAPLPTPVAMDDANYGTYLTQVAAVTATTTSPGYDAATGENCADHGKPIPVVPPDPQIVANGLWYSGTPYLGVQTIGSSFASTPLPPGISLQNTSAGYAYMWHSHDEREITTNDVFPGGMMMMLIIDPPGTSVDETK